MITLNDFELFIHEPLPYEQGLVNVVTCDKKQLRLLSASELYLHHPKTVKIEGFERYNKAVWDAGEQYAVQYGHNGPVTCHAFFAESNSPSFDTHTDPDDVVVHCCSGVKIMEVDGVVHTLQAGQHVYIPHGTPHRAINIHKSLMLSFGLERFWCDKIKC